MILQDSPSRFFDFEDGHIASRIVQIDNLLYSHDSLASIVIRSVNNQIANIRHQLSTINSRYDINLQGTFVVKITEINEQIVLGVAFYESKRN